ncbi:VOC family protein [Halobacillus mangrovi]|uniref:VOC family protein n=1 Tax=Halobacillus mangrovi TaxID=402384 RepID=UPI003D99464A
MKKVTPFLMFQEGNAEEAMKFYTSVIEGSEIKSVTRYGAEGPGKEGTVMQAVFTLRGQEIMCIDSPSPHDFDFTPSFSLFITCESMQELERYYEKLGENGEALMPLDNYGFSQKFGWVVDRYGVSWQLNFE